MRFYEAIFLIVLFLSNIQGEGRFHINQTYDLNKNGQKETLLLNAYGTSAMWVEILDQGILDTLWSYSALNGERFADGELVDIDNDNYMDLIIIPDLYAAIGNQVWCYIFLGNENGFSDDAITIEESLLGLTTIRPSNLSIVPTENSTLAVSFGSPARKGMLFDIEIIDKEVIIKKPIFLSAPIISNGYGSVYIGCFINDGSNYIALLTPEGNKLKTAIFDGERPNKLLFSETLTVDKARHLMGSEIQQYKSNGLLVPFGTDDVFQLLIVNEKVLISNTSLSGQNAFPLSDESDISSILNKRENVETVDIKTSDVIPSQYEAIVLNPPPAIVPDESSTFNPNTFIDKIDNKKSIMDDGVSYYEKNIKVDNKKDYSNLTPTLTDFLNTVKSNSPQKTLKEDFVSIPIMNQDMKSTNWADEAGFTQLELGEYVPESLDTTNTSPIPNIDEGIAFFREEVIDSIQSSKEKNDNEYLNENKGIDLYYVLAMTSISETKDRYVFDGEAPFGIAVNQIPLMGKATHLQHGISADLSKLKIGEVYDFAYSLRDARLDSITTLTMVHDMQTNIVFMSISPTDDSLSQSYTSESFDPKLFEFPNYFFEGFPTSLDMDFTEKLIRFSFNENKDSTYKGIYLSSTTPSNPSQSLAVFMDQGTLQSIRGEIVVRANGSKKVSTEFDLIGNVKPAVMFSRLIQEMFPEDLKLKLLQGASLEEPLFGPSGKLPKITREPRLPEVQPDQIETSIPIEAKQSNVPETIVDSLSSKKIDKVIANPETQIDEINPKVLEVEKRLPENSVKKDSLKLETRKEDKILKKEIKPSAPEESQPEQEPIKNESTIDKD
ncbi:MAG: hypothetical protein ACJZ12_05395 [Candidatus Neomarinimicrobiota bacterium]